ncbi:hypothetical protein Y1Q_0014744 [Alligator mississippiensis]|uniref:Uncharacterized protein n=1 Tax=Alligator mississippiensis TaxID=8496 RepID=A0A151M1S3_ALLMI|nr:hypothetical protein Y1Q_0014744 [Alligator mississippiensis]
MEALGMRTIQINADNNHKAKILRAVIRHIDDFSGTLTQQTLVAEQLQWPSLVLPTLLLLNNQSKHTENVGEPQFPLNHLSCTNLGHYF